MRIDREYHIVGVDLGKTSMRAKRYRFIEQEGELRIASPEMLGSKSISTPQSSAEEIISACAQLINSLSATGEPLTAIGVGVFGIIDSQKGRVVKSGTLPFWNEVNLAEALVQLCNHESFIINDVHAAAAGTNFLRAGSRPFALVQLGTSVGVSAGGGHLQQIWSMPDFGQVSRLIDSSGVDLASQLGGRGFSANSSRYLGRLTTPMQVFSMAVSGDRKAQVLVRRYLTGLAELCAMVAVLLVPEDIVLGGGVARGLKSFFEELEHEYLDNVTHLWRKPRLMLSQFDDAPELGAAVWAGTQCEQ